MTAPHRAISSRIKRPMAPGSLPTGSAESSSKRLRTSGERTASAISPLIRLTISSDVRGGAATANHANDEKPDKVSAMVGTSGRAAIRRSVATPSSRSWRALTNCNDTPQLQAPIKDPARFPWHEVSQVQHYWLEVDALTQPMQVREDARPYGEAQP